IIEHVRQCWRRVEEIWKALIRSMRRQDRCGRSCKERGQDQEKTKTAGPHCSALCPFTLSREGPRAPVRHRKGKCHRRETPTRSPRNLQPNTHRATATLRASNGQGRATM